MCVVFSGNTSREDLDKFSERFIDQEDGDKDRDVTVTMATTQGTTGQGSVSVPSAASLPVSLVKQQQNYLTRIHHFTEQS